MAFLQKKDLDNFISNNDLTDPNNQAAYTKLYKQYTNEQVGDLDAIIKRYGGNSNQTKTTQQQVNDDGRNYDPSTQFTSYQNKKQVGQIQSDSDNYNNNLQGTQQALTSSAQDQAKRSLADDIQGVKANSNSRGLLYSGLEGGGEANAKASASSKLAGSIQNINNQTQNIADSKKQLAFGAQMGLDNQQLENASLQAQQNQTSYQQALEEQQNQNNFFGSLFGGIGKIVGGLLGTGK